MGYDEDLAVRVRRAVGPRGDVSERKMFGGLCFLLDNKMFCGIVKNELMARVGPDRHEEALRKRHARPMDFTGRPMHGYVYVEAAGCRTVKAVQAWITPCLEFVATLEATPAHARGRKSAARFPRAKKRAKRA